MSIVVSEFEQISNVIRGKCGVTCSDPGQVLDKKLNVDKSVRPAELHIKVLRGNTQNRRWLIFVRLSLPITDSNADSHVCTAKFSSKELDIMNRSLTCGDSWDLIKSCSGYDDKINFSFIIHLIIGYLANPFAQLHEDTELSDFELSGDDGAVKVHKLVLAMTSPVFRTMLSGDWRETGEGRVQVPGTTRDTLQQLKDYIYLRTVPETGLEQLLLLAGYYMMPDLECLCIDKLTESYSENNVKDLLDFAVKHNLKQLSFAILTKFRTIDYDKIEEIEKSFSEH